jgi:hypothetical protein
MTQNGEVKDQSALSAYLAKRTEWFAWYEGIDEPNSIWRQINLMIFSEMSYRVVRQERDRGFESDASSPVVSYLADTAYFGSQMLSIRKLLERDSKVISLNRVLKDLKQNRNLITREVFVSYDGTQYEPGTPTISVPGLQPDDSPFTPWFRSTRRHELFDKLSMPSGAQRSRKDVIQDGVFWRLENWIKTSGANKLILLCNKYLAHAATSKSIAGLQSNGISFEQVESVQRTLVRVTKAIYDLILTSGVYSPVVGMPQLGYFGKVWEGSELVPRVKRMNDDWDHLEKVRNSWPDNLEEDLLT